MVKKIHVLILVGLALAGSLLGSAMTLAQTTVVTRSGANELIVPLFKSRVVSLEGPANRVSIGNPDIADILILRASQLYVLGKDLGTTNVLVWDSNDRLLGTVSVEVVHDLESLKEKLHVLLPDEPIEVYSAQRSLVLAGRVSNVANMNAALRIADSYLTQIQTATEADQFEQESGSNREDRSVGQIINLMQVGGSQQVMLEVKVAEIARTELKRLNARFNAFSQSSRWNIGGVNGGASFPDGLFDTGGGLGTGGLRIPVFTNEAPFGPVIDEFLPNDLFIEDQGLFGSFLSKDFLFNLALDAARENGLAKILAEPTLTTLTGQEAQFLSGGEFPIPVPRGDDGVTIEFKEFGVGLRFLPVVLDKGQINLKINITVSELISPNSVGVSVDGVSTTFLVPALSKRSANATVELADGQTMGMAGLINEDLREVVTKFPGLGNVPVLGALFRSQEFIKGETELVILVTPHLAKPIPRDEIRLPTDGFVEPSDAQFYLLGKLEGRTPKRRDFGHEVE